MRWHYCTSGGQCHWASQQGRLQNHRCHSQSYSEERLSIFFQVQMMTWCKNPKDVGDSIGRLDIGITWGAAELGRVVEPEILAVARSTITGAAKISHGFKTQMTGNTVDATVKMAWNSLCRVPGWCYWQQWKSVICAGYQPLHPRTIITIHRLVNSLWEAGLKHISTWLEMKCSP